MRGAAALACAISGHGTKRTHGTSSSTGAVPDSAAPGVQDCRSPQSLPQPTARRPPPCRRRLIIAAAAAPEPAALYAGAEVLKLERWIRGAKDGNDAGEDEAHLRRAREEPRKMK